MAGKADIVEYLSSEAGLTKKQAGDAVDAVFDCVGKALAGGDRVQIPGFGSFQISERKERKGRNPKTKEEITIPASNSVRFKPGKALKDSVN